MQQQYMCGYSWSIRLVCVEGVLDSSLQNAMVEDLGSREE